MYTFMLVWDCHQSQMILAECNNVQLLWVLEHKGIEANETADQLAKRGLWHPFIASEPDCGISELQDRSSGTGCAENTKNTGSLFQNKAHKELSF
jgi:hypothetical protein